VAVLVKVDGKIPPASFNLAPCLCQFVFADFGADDSLAQRGRDRLGVRANVSRIASDREPAWSNLSTSTGPIFG
jgi:hypothetical protein